MYFMNYKNHPLKKKEKLEGFFVGGTRGTWMLQPKPQKFLENLINLVIVNLVNIRVNDLDYTVIS